MQYTQGTGERLGGLCQVYQVFVCYDFVWKRMQEQLYSTHGELSRSLYYLLEPGVFLIRKTFSWQFCQALIGFSWPMEAYRAIRTRLYRA